MVFSRRNFNLRRHGLAAACALGWGACALAQPASMTNADYAAARRVMSAELHAARVACGTQSASRREVCMADVEGRDWIAKADLEVAYRSKPSSRAEASLARVDARFWVAREQCDDVARVGRAACLERATAERTSARDRIAAQRKREEHAAACADTAAWIAGAACPGPGAR